MKRTFLILASVGILQGCLTNGKEPAPQTAALERLLINDAVMFAYAKYPPTGPAVTVEADSSSGESLRRALRKLGYAVHTEKTERTEVVALRIYQLERERWLLAVTWGRNAFSRIYAPVTGSTGWAGASPWTYREQRSGGD